MYTAHSTTRLFFIAILRTFGRFLGWQGHGGLRASHTTMEASIVPHQCYGGCSCLHPLPGGGGRGIEHIQTSSARPEPKRVPHKVPKPAEQSFQHVSQFEPHGALAS